MKESGLRENRVRPLAQTFVSAPLSTKARRSAFRSTRFPSSIISKSRKSITSCAIKRRGSRSINAFQSASSYADILSPNTTP